MTERQCDGAARPFLDPFFRSKRFELQFKTATLEFGGKL